MGDLISRSALINVLKEKMERRTNNAILRIFLIEAIKLVENQPIAYNVEKVVAELKKDAFTDGYGDYTDCEKLITLEYAIDDVRNGCKE